MAIPEYWYRYEHEEIGMPKVPDIPDDQRDPQSFRLLGQPHIRDVGRDLAAEFTRRWYSEALRAEVLKSQRRHLFIQQALMVGRRRAWDFEPSVDTSYCY